jgi:3',5'-cyclic-AMP phosphodiesterase
MRFLRELEVPVAYCFGNHDLGTVTAFDLWTSAPHPPNVRHAECVVALDGLDVVLVNNSWIVDGTEVMCWNARAKWQESVSEARLEWLHGVLKHSPDRPAILVIHTPPDPIPPRLTGMTEPIHAASSQYVTALRKILTAHHRVKLVLSGHNHVTMATHHGEQVHLSTSALVEPPFEFRLIDCCQDCLTVKTIAAIPMPADASYDHERAWVNGQPRDRELVVRW